MAGVISIKIILFFLIFGVNTVSSQVVNTSQYDNFTIEWENFNLLTCAVPTTINISRFNCLPRVAYQYVDDMICLNETTINFDQTTCDATTTAVMYTSSASQTTIQTSTSTAPTTIQSRTTASTTSYQSNNTVTTLLPANTTASITTNITNTTMIPATTTASTTNASTISSTTTNVSSATSVTGSSTVNTTTTPGTTHASTTIPGSTNASTTTPSSTNASITTVALTTTTTTANIYSCQTDEYIGSYCNMSSDACAMSQPCRNLATCYPNNTLPYGYYCLCRTGYAGDNCENDARACMENTCWHNGTCVPVNVTISGNNGSNFRCECVEGYDGVYCELKIDLCGNITCENRGICLTTDMVWKCMCLDSTLYYGDYCQFKTSKLKLREILSKSFASIAIGAIVTTCGFIVIMDILKYAFHIDPVEFERESYRKRLADRKRARQPMKYKGPRVALRFQYIS